MCIQECINNMLIIFCLTYERIRYLCELLSKTGKWQNHVYNPYVKAKWSRAIKIIIYLDLVENVWISFQSWKLIASDTFSIFNKIYIFKKKYKASLLIYLFTIENNSSIKPIGALFGF